MAMLGFVGKLMSNMKLILLILGGLGLYMVYRSTLSTVEETKEVSEGFCGGSCGLKMHKM